MALLSISYNFSIIFGMTTVSDSMAISDLDSVRVLLSRKALLLP